MIDILFDYICLDGWKYIFATIYVRQKDVKLVVQEVNNVNFELNVHSTFASRKRINLCQFLVEFSLFVLIKDTPFFCLQQ